MAISQGVKTRSSQKTVLPVDADRTTVVLAQEPAPPHIAQTLADCTPTPFVVDRFNLILIKQDPHVIVDPMRTMG